MQALARLKDRVELTDSQIIQRLRQFVEPGGRKGTWLRHLDDKQLAEVYHRLRMNHSMFHVIKIVQRDWGLLQGSEPRSLYRALKSFRVKAVGLLKAHASSYPRTEEKTEFVRKEEAIAKQILKKINGMDELAWLIQTQRGRLEVMVERERVGLPMKGTDRTAEQLRECIDTFLKYAVEMGLIDSKPKEYNLNLKTQFDGLLADVVQDDGSKIIETTTRFLEMAERKALIMRKLPDGSYVADKEDDKK